MHGSRHSAWDSESSWSVKLTEDIQFILRKERKGKEELYIISVFCINKDYYFKIVWIISGGSASSSIGWMWLWVGVLAIHSKKRSGNSFPWDEIFWTWKWAKRLGSDFWPFGWMMPKLPSAHCNSIMYAALPVFWDQKLLNTVIGPEKPLGMGCSVEQNSGDISTQLVTLRTYLHMAY